MRTIATLNGPEFLRACNRVRHAVADFLAETDVLTIRKILPEIPEDATDEEKKLLLQKQGRKNFGAMLDRLLDEKPEATYKLLCTLIIPDTPGQEPDGMDLITAGLDLVCAPKVMDFFIRSAKLAEQTMAD